MKVGTKVQTPHGTGIITKTEVYRLYSRYGVVHDKPCDQYRNGEVAFYLIHEIKSKEILCEESQNKLSLTKP